MRERYEPSPPRATSAERVAEQRAKWRAEKARRAAAAAREGRAARLAMAELMRRHAGEYADLHDLYAAREAKRRLNYLHADEASALRAHFREELLREPAAE